MGAWGKSFRDFLRGKGRSKVKDIVAGQTISHYRITEKLGSGGMGEIYKAEDIKLKRTVALKFLPSSFSSDEESKKRLIHEAQAASSLDHPNICTIYEIGETDNELLFISMALYDGETLKDKIAKGPIEIDEAIKITLQICEGLEKAHKNEIIHRDIKPANIFITNDGIVKILDFGLAKSKGQTQLTQMGSTMGTVDYMSPEQATGSVIDKRTDIWSLGVMFYEMVTGQRPFAAEYEQAVIYSILNTEPDLSKLSIELASIVNKAINKSPEKRYQTSREMIIDLEALSGVAKPKIKLSYPGLLSRFSLKSRIIAGVVLMMATVLVLYFNLFQPSNNAVTKPERKMIVVLPFENLGSPDDDYFAEGVRDEISNKLASLASLGVISRNSAEKYANTKKTAKEIGKELGVDYILAGSIRWAKSKGKESRIRIIPQLVRVSDDVSIWSESFDKVINDIFDVQNDIAQNVVDNLGIKILPGHSVTGPPPTKNLDAYDYYLKAHTFHYGPSTGANIKTAVKLYEQALKLDPDFAAAHAQLSIAYNGLFKWYWDRDSLNLKKAALHLRKAMELNPNIAEVHLAKFFYYVWFTSDQEKIFDELKRTLEIQPNNAEANADIAGYYRDRGESDLALKYESNALRLDPLNARYPYSIALRYEEQRDYKTAELYFKKALELSPNTSGYYVDLAENYIDLKGNTKLARQTVKNVKDSEYLEGHHNIFIYLNILDRKFDEALLQLKSSKNEYNQTASSYISNLQMIALVYRYQNKVKLSKKYFESSIIQIEKMISGSPNDFRLPLSLSLSYAGLGEKEKALIELKKGIKLLDFYFDKEWIKNTQRFYLTQISILVGDYDTALQKIDLLLSNPTGFSVNILKLDPLYDPLRNLKEYKSIVEKYSAESEKVD